MTPQLGPNTRLLICAPAGVHQDTIRSPWQEARLLHQPADPAQGRGQGPVGLAVIMGLRHLHLGWASSAAVAVFLTMQGAHWQALDQGPHLLTGTDRPWGHGGPASQLQTQPSRGKRSGGGAPKNGVFGGSQTLGLMRLNAAPWRAQRRGAGTTGPASATARSICVTAAAHGRFQMLDQRIFKKFILNMCLNPKEKKS